MTDFDNDKAKKIYRKDTNDPRKRAKIVKSKKGRTTKIYAINIERKRLLKKRREKVLQNAKDRKLTKGNPLTALQADRRANRNSKNKQSSTNTNNEMVDGFNTDAIIGVQNTNNAVIAAENVDNAATDAENTNNAAINVDNTSNAATDGKKSDNAAMSDDSTDNTATGDDNADNTTTSDDNTNNTATGNGNTENTTTGNTSIIEVPSSLHYGRKTKDPSKIKTSKKHTPISVEPSIGDPLPDEITRAKASGDTFDPMDVHIYEFLIQGTPNPLDLEGIEED